MSIASEVGLRGRTGDPSLVTPDWLAAHLHDSGLRVVEVDVSASAYDEWHIDGAVFWNVYRDLKDEHYQPLATRSVERLVRQAGIEAGSTVVFYGYASAFGAWLMELYGHRDVQVLDCSRDTWRGEGRPWTVGTVIPTASSYRLAEPDPQLRATRQEVAASIGRAGVTLVDVRSASEYEGERFWPSGGKEPGGRAGHVPSARHHPVEGLYDGRGAFLPLEELRDRFSALLEADDELITYCTIGGRAATAWFVLSHLLGRSGVRVYEGSWAEWGRTPGVEVAAP